ncbi:MAG: adenylate/guanylate cyclase domain-containing protein [Pseudomonadota bacterium]
MTLSGRARREWRIVLWLSLGSAVLSGYFGYAVGGEESGPWHAVVSGVLHSLVIATPIILFEAKGQHLAVVRRMRRLPLGWYFALRVAFYAVVILTGLIVVGGLRDENFAFDRVFRDALIFSISMAVITNVVYQIGSLLGFRTLRSLATGRYVKPQRERRTFLLIDMKNSTGIAERLGPILFHELLNDFFRDVADASLMCGAEIHKYVGDEAILTWPEDSGLKDGSVPSCPFVVRDMIAANGRRYRERFGLEPTFRAALHHGEIVAGEIGDVRREIAYVGDTLNVAARLLEAAKTLGHDVLASTDLLDRASLPPGVRTVSLPVQEMRGREAPLGVAALERPVAAKAA